MTYIVYNPDGCFVTEAYHDNQAKDNVSQNLSSRKATMSDFIEPHVTLHCLVPLAVPALG